MHCRQAQTARMLKHGAYLGQSLERETEFRWHNAPSGYDDACRLRCPA
jgi:hypothetical protein